MLAPCVLTIGLTTGRFRSHLTESTINQQRGGPETLLRWLETQLGLPTPERHRASLITEYAAALDAVHPSSIARSVATDRWATASELLSRRDQLLLAGWDGRSSDCHPEVVNDLARAAEYRATSFACVAERLQGILGALDDGQTLPAHRCILVDPLAKWPRRWQHVLQRLTLEQAEEVEPQATKGTALYWAQRVIRGSQVGPCEVDQTLRCVRALSHSAAVEFIGAVLASDRAKLARTAILCEDDAVALQLDACLNRRGLPTMGASVCSRAHPALQVLPLSLALCWDPVDPQALLDFLSLPVSPIPQRAASALAAALAEEPGIGSNRWEQVFRGELCSPTNDPNGKLAQLLSTWLCGARVPHSACIPTPLVRSRCAAVAQWAAGRAMLLAASQQSNLQLIAAHQTAAAQASLLGELAESQAGELTKPQLARLIEEALGQGAEALAFIEADGGPVRVRSLSEIGECFERLVWLGVGTADAVACNWSSATVRALSRAGIALDDGSEKLSALRSAEAAGFCHITQSVLAVLIPQDEQRRRHPLWLAITGSLQATTLENPPVLENLIDQNALSQLAPFTCQLQSFKVIRSQPLRSRWCIPTDLLCDRDSVSASELADRLACPLKWVLNYQARLRSSPIARLPDPFQLKGSFCHRLLHRVFNNIQELPAADEAVARILQAFDERINFDAAPLAQPDQTLERARLRSQMENSTRLLVETLSTGGYRIVGIEVEVSGHAFGKALVGSIDCLVQRQDGREAIIDFKYGGRTKYSTLIADGRAVQLATYAYSRRSGNGKTKRAERPFPAVAYLILSDGLLLTPSGSPIDGDSNRSIIDGPAIDQVWQRFEAAIRAADGWLSGTEHVCARPHLQSSDWPQGSDIVLDQKLRPDESQAVCKYCQYTQICGIEGLS